MQRLLRIGRIPRGLAREKEEASKTVHSLQKYSWTVVQNAKIPSRISVPLNLDGLQDRLQWSTHMTTHYDDLLGKVSDSENEKTRRLNWAIYEGTQE